LLAGVVVVEVVVVVDGGAGPPEPPGDWPQLVTCGATRKIWTPACLSALLSASLACW
jgi:hypothetical protein